MESEKSKEKHQVAQSESELRKRMHIYWFRAWEDGQITGRAHMDLIKGRRVHLNLHLNMYTSGKWPWFRDKNKAWEATVNIPIWVLKDIVRQSERWGARGVKDPDSKVKIKYLKGFRKVKQ